MTKLDLMYILDFCPLWRLIRNALKYCVERNQCPWECQKKTLYVIRLNLSLFIAI